MTTRVLFLCPHSAGKSVFAATYFRAAAARLGADVEAAVAGTDPDDEVMPNVRAAIEAQGFGIVDEPRRVSTDQIDAADIVVSIGCALDDLAHGDPALDDLVEWDVPMLNEHFRGSMNAIHAHAEGLAAQMARSESMVG